MTPNHVDYHCLLALGACREQVKQFREVFGDGPVEITVANAEAARAAGLGVSFLADTLRAEYERQVAPLWAEYERQRAPLWAEYERQRAPLLAEYERQRDALLVTLLNQPEDT